MKDKAQIAGILTIVSGAFGFFWLGGSWSGIYMLKYMLHSSLYSPMPIAFYNLVAIIYLAYGIFGAALGVLGIVGGILSLKRRRWGWALAGTIAGIITFFPVGIAAIILLSMGKDEFTPVKPVIP
jgi:hypothetical protein